MNAYVAEHGLPKTAMDDLEIILDELCAGYRNDVECRLRKEYFDHYTTAYEDAIDEGWVEEMAHKKALQDLGWETTLKISKVCVEMSPREHSLVHFIMYGKLRKPENAIVGYFALICLGALLFCYAVARQDTILISLTVLGSVGSVAELLRIRYKSNNAPDSSSVVIVNVWQSGIRFFVLNILLWAVFFAFSWAFYDFSQGHRIFFIYMWVAIWSVLLHVLRFVLLSRKFIKTWNRYYPDDRIS